MKPYSIILDLSKKELEDFMKKKDTNFVIFEKGKNVTKTIVPEEKVYLFEEIRLNIIMMCENSIECDAYNKFFSLEQRTERSREKEQK